MVNSKQKGSRGERAVAHLLQEYGIDSHRTQQYCGNTGDAADVTFPGFHTEVKFRETTAIWDWLCQAKHDAKEDETPIVVFRKSREKWHVCLEFEDFLTLLGYEKHLHCQAKSDTITE